MKKGKQPVRRQVGWSVARNGSKWRVRWRDPIGGQQKSHKLDLHADQPKDEAERLAVLFMESVQTAADASPNFLTPEAKVANAIVYARRYLASVGEDPEMFEYTISKKRVVTRTLGELWVAYKTHLQKLLAKESTTAGTLSTIESRINCLMKRIPATTPLGQIDRVRVLGFLQDFDGSAGRANRLVSSARTMFAFGKDSLGWIEENAFSKIPALPTDDRPPTLWTADALAQAMDSAQSDEGRLLFLFGYYHGIRLMDIATLRWEFIDADFVLRFRPSKTKRKSKVEVVAPLHPKVKAALGPRQKTGHVLPAFAVMKQTTVSWWVLEVMTSAKIERQPRPDHRPLNFHALRHTCNSRLHNMGCPDSICKRLLGHSTKGDVHSTYTHLDIETLRAWVERL